ncbi:acyltransferase [Neiella sp. HB171785]|uniref:Acyltransferase n=1 Tax=Neiella litorisoli TaxID=2771431 RepID=A0A8J6QV75_9GAMM|nr:acyltransferase [Neiella litorisoli]MBD1390997.1 acyltransferase [Neiella litorisoli]
MINSIQVLRGLAALYVVVYHSAIKVEQDWFVAQLGASGVDLFFIISGFIITHTFLNKPDQTTTEFLTKRIIRIVPMYWLTTLAYAALLLLFPSAFSTHSFDLLHTIKSLLFISLEDYPVVYTGWTLSFEMYFYVLFGLMIATTATHTPKIIATALLLSTLLGLLLPGQSSYMRDFFTSPLLTEFSLGVVLAYLYRAKIPVSNATSICLLLVGFAGLYVLRDMDRFVSFGLPMLLVFMAIVLNRNITSNNRLLLLLGDASYSIYLTHVLSLPALHVIASKLGLYSASMWSIIPLFIAYTLVSTMIGVIAYWLAEKPMTAALSQWQRKQSKPAPVLP